MGTSHNIDHFLCTVLRTARRQWRVIATLLVMTLTVACSVPASDRAGSDRQQATTQPPTYAMNRDVEGERFILEAGAEMYREHCAVCHGERMDCLLYTSPSPRDVEESRMPSSA